MKEKTKKLLEKDRKSLALMAVAVAVLLILIIGASYAYFAANIGGGTSASINASTGTIDSLSFSVGKDIEIHATLDNFYEGHESLKGETTATATLKANNVTNQATGRYNVFFIIDNNDFEYSTEEGQTELLLKVTDPNGNEVMDITGLKRVEGGFDITTRTGGFLITADYDIEATPTKTLESQTWKLEVTFVNLDIDQNVNKGKSLNGRFYITTEKESTYQPTEINSIVAISSYNSITANLTSLAGSAEIDKYYYAIEEDTSGVAYLGAGVSVARLSNQLAINDTDYIESDEAIHIFDNLKPNTKYKVYSYAVDKNKIKSNVYETEVTTASYFIPIIESVTTSNTTTSIMVSANSKRGSEEIDKYYYSIDDGEFIESNDSSYIFNGLAENTSYTIKVKAVDITGAESEMYTLTAKTVTLASITNVTTSVTSSSITVNVIAKKGDANIASYYYSKDNGATWSEATPNSSYTFNDLASDTTYQIKVKVVDTEGRESSEAAATAKTGYVLASITNVTHSTTLNSIIVNVTAQSGSNVIVKYYYSKDNGSTYEESDSSTHTFDNLLDTTSYKIKIKVKDSEGNYSTEYYEAIATTTYINPSITKVVGTSTYNSITLDITANAGTNEVAKYYYNIDGGQDIELNGSNPTITGLTEQKEYNLNIKVEDTNGRKSNAYNLRVTTKAYLLASVSNVGKTVTTNAINLTVTAEAGDGTIASYEYSKDGGTNWSTSANNTYSFTGLSDNQAYQIRVRVKDSNGRYSEIYEEEITTSVYVNPSVTKVDATSTYNSITLTVTATRGTNNVSKYYFSEDNGSTWTSGQTSNVYTFNGLTENKAYSIKVKVSDTNNKESGVVSKSVTTNAYVAPMVNATISKTYNSITINAIGTAGDGTIAKYMYSKDGGSNWTTQTSTSASNSYVFSGLTFNTTYSIRVKVVDNNNRESTIYSVSVKTDAPAMATYIKDLYTSQGVNGLYYHNSSLTNGAGDNSYRYAGADPNNYVCFGSTLSPCPSDNLYRIIGVFGSQVKLIKADYAQEMLMGADGSRRVGYGYTVNDTTNTQYKGSLTFPHVYYWNTSTSKNVWSESDLNTVNLNTNFINNIGSSWKNFIVNDIWYVGGMVRANGNGLGAKTAYDYELGTNKSEITYSAKVGLMYVSEYYYAALPTFWTLPGYTASTSPDVDGNYGEEYDYRKAFNDNWMDIGLYDWTISPVPTDSSTVSLYAIANSNVFRTANGYMSWAAGTSNAAAIRPSFKLDANVLLASGNGTQSNPYRIVVTAGTEKPTITSFVAAPTSSSLKVVATANAGSNAISTFYFSGNRGSTWTKSTTNSMTYNNLKADSSYVIQVKVVDANGIESAVSEATFKTSKEPATLSATTAPIAAGETTSTITYTGDGVVSCTPKSPSKATYASCSYDDSTKTITFTRLKVGTQSFTISATEGTTYAALANTTVSVSVKGITPTFTLSSTAVTIAASETSSAITYTYDGDGTIQCTGSGTTYADCIENESKKTITFTRSGTAGGTQRFSIRALAGVNSSSLAKMVTVTIEDASATLATTCEGQNMATCFMDNYTKDSSIYYHNSSLTTDAGDNSYRYLGADPNNYVCFGSTASTCPSNNLYRIIGIFDNQVKLIKNTSIGNYYWSGSSSNSSNTWSNSTFNTDVLNGTYLNGFTTTWKNKIATTSWKVGGMEQNSGNKAKQYYDTEVGKNSSGTTYSAKIGLMYISDYGYAAYRNAWTTILHSYDNSTITANNWLYSGVDEWSISRRSDTSNGAFHIINDGYVYDLGTAVVSLYDLAARPTFFLNSSVVLSSGSGTSSDPYRIS